MRKRERERIARAVERELRPGGRPIAKYMELDVIRRLPPYESLRLTNAIFRNLEERLVAIEEALA